MNGNNPVKSLYSKGSKAENVRNVLGLIIDNDVRAKIRGVGFLGSRRTQALDMLGALEKAAIFVA